MPVRPTRTTFLAVAVAATAAMAVPTIVSVSGSGAAGAATAAAITAPSGQPMPTVAPRGYVTRFTDDFTTGTKPDSNKWNTYVGQPGGDPAGYWAQDHAVVRDGKLVLEGYKDKLPDGSTKLVTGGVSNRFSLRQKYGYFMVRARMDKGQGVSYAMLTWPNDQSGPPELDFAEDNGAYDRSQLNTFTHYGTGAKKQQVRKTLAVDMSKWHTIGMQWGPNRINYVIDGRAWSTVPGKDVVSHLPMFLALQTQAWPCGLSYQNCASSNTAVTPAKINMEVDWVAVFRPKAGTVPA